MFTSEQLFTRNINLLCRAVMEPTAENLFDASAKLRQLLADATPLLHLANRKHKLKLTFDVSQWPKDQFYGYSDLPHPVLLHDFLAWPIARLNGVPATVHQHIAYLANFSGAVHKNTPTTQVDKLLEGFGTFLMIDDMPAPIQALLPVCRVVIDGCTPLYEAINNGRPG